MSNSTPEGTWFEGAGIWVDVNRKDGLAIICAVVKLINTTLELGEGPLSTRMPITFRRRCPFTFWVNIR